MCLKRMATKIIIHSANFDSLRLSSYTAAVRTLQTPTIMKMVSAAGDVLLLAMIGFVFRGKKLNESRFDMSRALSTNQP